MEASSVVKVALLLGSGQVPGVEGPYALIQFDLKPGWHIYWENSGDTGMPTRFSLDLPEGVEASPAVWSVPHAIERPGELTDFGYERHASIAIPLSERPESLTGDVRYLVCKEDLCVPGSAELSLSERGRDLPHDMPTPLPPSGRTLALPEASAVEVFCDLTLAQAGCQQATLSEGVLTFPIADDAHGTVLVRATTSEGEALYSSEL